MSWLARSLVNSLRGAEENEDASENEEQNPIKSPTNQQDNQEHEDDDDDPTRGVREDLSELTKTLTRQFWGVASFLAPPPASTDPPPSDQGHPSDPTSSDDSPRSGGIRSDLAEIGGRFKSGISMLSNTIAVSEISKIASTFLPLGEEAEEEEELDEENGVGVVGVSEEVVAFARNVSMHPETWLDFPLVADEDDFDELDMSDVQQEHALAVERLAPRLAALRIELCPSHMSEGRFWKIYFVLLQSRLSRTDAELLTTPQIVQAREMLLQDLQSRSKPSSQASGKDETPLPSETDASVPQPEPSVETSSSNSATADGPFTSISITGVETEKHTVQTTEVKIIDKPVIEENSPVQVKNKAFGSNSSSNNHNTISIQKYEEDEDGDDEWLKEEEEETDDAAGTANVIPLGNEEDVTFSDLEEDDDQGTSRNSKTTTKDGASSNDRDSSDWLDVNEIDEE